MIVLLAAWKISILCWSKHRYAARAVIKHACSR